MRAVGSVEENMMSRTKMRMLRWLLGVSRVEHIPNTEIRHRCGVADIKEKMGEARLRWYGHWACHEKRGRGTDTDSARLRGGRK